MFQRPHPDWFEPTRSVSDPCWELHYHGTAGFTVKAMQTRIILDPFVTRPGLMRTLLGRLVPNEALIEQVFPRADGVLVGHSHHDHILDAPMVARKTGAKFVGSRDSANVAIAAGLDPSQIVLTEGREDIHLGSATIRGIPSNHGRVYFNRVTLPGGIPTPPPWPPRVWNLRHGAVLNWMVELGGLRMVHIDSAEVIDAELEGLKADVVCLCAIGRRHRPGLVESVVKALEPRWVVPCHWDWFFTPYGSPTPLLPGVDLPGFLDEIREAGAEPILLPIGGNFLLSEGDLVG